MKVILNIFIEDKFKVSKGLILTGGIDAKNYGKIESGYYIKFISNKKTLLRKIIEVDYFRPPHYKDYEDVKIRYVGLLLECENEEEFIEILNSKAIRQESVIYKD